MDRFGEKELISQMKWKSIYVVFCGWLFLVATFGLACGLKGLDCRNDADCPTSQSCRGGWCQQAQKKTKTGCVEKAVKTCAPTTSQGLEHCTKGQQVCTDGKWGDCKIVPLSTKEACNGKDDNCNGKVDDGLQCECKEGDKRKCFEGDVRLMDVGLCKSGVQLCSNGKWGVCKGSQKPTKEVCGNNKDEDCNGKVDDGCTTAPPCVPNKFFQHVGVASSNEIKSIAWSRDGRWNVAATTSFYLLVWHDRKFVRVVTAPKEIKGFLISSDSKYLAVALTDDTIGLWELSTGKLIKVLKSGIHGIHIIAFLPGTSVLLTVVGSTYIEWEVATGEKKAERPRKEHSYSYVLSTLTSDGKLIAVTDTAFKTVYILDRVTQQIKAKMDKSCKQTVIGLAFQDSQKILIACAARSGQHEFLQGWDFSKPQPVKLFGHPYKPDKGGHIDVAQFNTDRTKIAVHNKFYGDALRVMDTRTGKLEKKFSLFKEDRFPIRHGVAYKPSGEEVMIVIKDQTFQVHRVKIFGLMSEKLVKELQTQMDRHDTGAHANAIDPTGRYMVTTAFQNRLLVWDMKSISQKQPAKLHKELSSTEGRISALAFSKDGRYLAAADSKFAIKIIDTKSWKTVHSLQKHNNRINSLAFSPDGAHLISSSYTEKTYILWSLKNGTFVKYLRQGTQNGFLFFSPDGSKLAFTEFGQNRVVLVKFPGGELVDKIQIGERAQGLTFHSDGQSLMYVSGGDLVKIDLKTKQAQKKNLYGVIRAYNAMFSPNSRVLALKKSLGGIDFYNVDTAKYISDIREGKAKHSKFAMFGFGRSSKQFFTFHIGGNIRMWSCPTTP